MLNYRIIRIIKRIFLIYFLFLLSGFTNASKVSDYQNSLNEKYVSAGGFGGNKLNHKISYDGLKNHFPKLQITRNNMAKICFMKNNYVIIKNYKNDDIENFFCDKLDKEHGSIYWNGEFHSISNNYSPDNDLLFGATIMAELFDKWYQIPLITDNDGHPQQLTIMAHSPIANAYWDGKKLTVGDYINVYPNVASYMVSDLLMRKFIEQNSKLIEFGQSGAIKSAFSDIAIQVKEFYISGKNTWMSHDHYFDQPSKDCQGRQPGDNCSIDDASQYYDGLSVQFGSGVFNRFFYLLANSKGWDVKNAFAVILYANNHYWKPDSNFIQGICSVIKSAQDLGHPLGNIIESAKVVKIDLSDCVKQ